MPLIRRLCSSSRKNSPGYLIIAVMPYVAHRRVKGLSTPFRANVVQMAEYLWIEDEK